MRVAVQEIDEVEIELAAIDAELTRRQQLQRQLEVIRARWPRVFRPFLQPSRYKGAHGGRGSAKSHIFAELLVTRAAERPGLRWICAREIQNSLKESSKRLIEDKIEALKLPGFRVMDREVRTPKGGVFIFEGMQSHTVDSLKSFEGFDGVWIEEAHSISDRSLTLLRPTIRKPGSEIWASWNPDKETDPIDVLLRKNPPPDSIVVSSSWRDNPYFPDVLRREMEWDRSRDTEKYEHVWEGQYEKASEARVFKNWHVEDFETPSDVKFLLGSDFGYSPDPATLVRCFVQGKKLFVDAEAYKVQCEVDHLPVLYDTIDNGAMRSWEIVADSSRPDTISYLKRHGYPRVVGAIKGKDSIREGIAFLKTYDIVVHPRCIHTIDELKSYSHVVDKLTGVVTPLLVDDKNHIIDPLRYATEKLNKAISRAGTW